MERPVCRRDRAEKQVSNATVTPWEVTGEIDYDKLIKQFGTQPITEELLQRIAKHTGGLHPQLRRRLFYSHRDLDVILNEYEKGNKFYLYTGRGPSGPVHIGHLVPWIFTRHLQEKFDAKLYFQVTDDERYLYHEKFSQEDTYNNALDNILDVIAVGFDKNKTKIIIDSRAGGVLYKLAVRIAKHVTLSTAKAVFGFQDSTNIGLAFYPAIQAAPAFLESELTGKSSPCLIPAAIDQDPFWRVTRDVAPKLGFPKPAQIHSKFLPGLGQGGKMSASHPETAIFTTDSAKEAQAKISSSFTGGQATRELHRKLGGNPDICPVFAYHSFFTENDQEVENIYGSCRSGELFCGECKAILAPKVTTFLADHQKKRDAARKVVNDYLIQS